MSEIRKVSENSGVCGSAVFPGTQSWRHGRCGLTTEFGIGD